jgi:CheY-like chemotaxis protein
VRGLRILFVEDNSVNRQLALIHLKDLECRIVLAENGQKGVESFIAEAFDLVLMDCQMPVMDGYMATEAIRAYEAPRGRYTPIVAVTASAIQGEKELCLAAGMDDVLTKPYSRSEFLAMIARWTQSRSRMT